MIIGVVSVAPAIAIARTNVLPALALAALVTVAGSALRAGARTLAPELARSYVLHRLCSPHYLVPVLGLPLLGGVLIVRFGVVGSIAVLAGQIVLAARYGACWVRPGALPFASLSALLSGVHGALECLALRGPELAMGSHRLLYAEQTRRQRIVLLEHGATLELFIDGALQFSSDDERLYHRGLLEPAVGLLGPDAHVLVLGGGDGLAARDLLASGRVARVAIADWDPAVTRLFRTEPRLRALNADALRDPRVQLVHRDVRSLLGPQHAAFDLIVGDLTDPEPEGSGAIVCSSAFYLALRKQLRPDGSIVTHTASSDGLAEDAVPAALQSAGFATYRYAVDVPSFQRVSYVLGVQRALTPEPLRLGTACPPPPADENASES